MRIEIKLFALAKQIAEAETVSVEVPDDSTVKQLRSALVDRFPAMSSMIDHVAFAVDAEYATDDAALSATSEVACIPPVSGG